MSHAKTEQEEFWRGSFGDEYIKRNSSEAHVTANTALFARALRRAGPLRDCLEFGANVGLNLRALRAHYPGLDAHAVEINRSAATELAKLLPPANVISGSILDYTPARRFDLVLLRGVLIHINPDLLPEVYRIAYEATGKYLLISEYYNPTPVSVVYRGHHDRLFKRDFCGEMLDAFPALALLDYGFCYHRDLSLPQDDSTWFLMEKTAI